MADLAADIALLTKSFAGDFELCRVLCASVDALMPDMTHYLVVERRDRKLFAQLETERRRILTTESLLPYFFCIRRRNGRTYWISPYRLKPVSGWYIQQYAKFAAVASRSEQAIIFADSDTEFIRPIDPEEIVRDGRTRFYREPLMRAEKHHIDWAREGARALNAPEAAEPVMNYVENLTVMDTRVTRLMLQHIARVAKSSWIRAVARINSMSEYCLYGQFITYVPGPHRDLVFTDDRRLCHSLFYDFDKPDTGAEDAFVRALSDHHVAFGIQSNIGMAADRRLALANRLKAAANLGR